VFMLDSCALCHDTDRDAAEQYAHHPSTPT